MAQDPVLQREMFNTRGRSAKGSGITSMVDDGSSGMTREERLQIAKAMLAEAQMKQNPEYYFNTLAQGDRPAMTRPVASSAPPPAMQQMPAAQQMAQMQAAGVRPVGMADGGIVRIGFKEGGPTFTERLGEYAKMPSDYIRREILGIEDKPEDAPMEPIVDFPDDGVPRDEDGNVLLFDPEGNRLDYIGDKALQFLPALQSFNGMRKLGKPGKSAVKPEDMQDIIDRNKKPTAPSGPFNQSSYGPQKPPPQVSPATKALQKDPTLNLSSFERLGLGEKALLSQNELSNSLRGDDKNKGILGFKGDPKGVQPGLSAPYPAASNVSSPENVPKKVEEEGTDKKPTGIEAIKADRMRQRDDNFNMALMQAGLAMMAGKSPNALANIGEGGIAGLQSFAAAEKEDRTFNAEQEKLAEDREMRLLRSKELTQEKTLTREARVYDIASNDIQAIDAELRKLSTDYGNAMEDSQKAAIQSQVEMLQMQRANKQQVINESLSRLGYEVPKTSSTPTAAVGSTISQDGVLYRVTAVGSDGKVTSAEPVQ